MAKSYTVVTELKHKKGWPTSQKKFAQAHEIADKAEKKKYGKSYNEMKTIDAKLKKDELAGHNTKTGKIDVSKKVPKKYRNEVSFHEKKEFQILKKLDNKSKKR